MIRAITIILCLACIPLGYHLLSLTLDGGNDFGVLINTILFCAGPVFIVGGFGLAIFVLVKKKPPVV